ncbi:hypothetical protein [Ochrobactrum sp. MYb379]|uniref:hypothetical protein n=1 Tax=Ochrobactrum sp. MYb379 TaxID=2745275 RepID=UPI003094D987
MAKKNVFMSNKLLICVVDAKGGSGKSFLTQIFVEAARCDGDCRVYILDGDTSNSDTISIFQDAKLVSMSEPEAFGKFALAIKKIENGEADHMVFDAGARDESLLEEMMPRMLQAAKKIGATLVVVRPINLSSHTHRNASNFTQGFARENNVPVVLCRSLAFADRPSDFDHWHNSQTRRNALDAGAVELIFSNLGRRWSTEAGGFGLSLADVGRGDFTKLGDVHDMRDAEAIFTEEVQLWIADWMSEAVEMIHQGIADALSNRGLLKVKNDKSS